MWGLRAANQVGRVWLWSSGDPVSIESSVRKFRSRQPVGRNKPAGPAKGRTRWLLATYGSYGPTNALSPGMTTVAQSRTVRNWKLLVHVLPRRLRASQTDRA